MSTLASIPPQTTAGDFKIIAAPFTPMKSDGSLNLSVIETYAEKLYQDGVAGVFVCGTTGEGFSLTLDERQHVAEAWRSAIGNRMSLIVHVGHSCNEAAVQLARHAERLEADGIASIGPIFFAPNSPQTLIETFQPIAAAAPQTPFYAYHMPSMSRVQFPANSWMLEMSTHIPSFRGVKFTHEDLEDFRACVTKANGTLEMFFGRDELFLSGLNMGARAAVGSTFNFAAPLYLRIAQAHAENQLEEASRLQELCTQAINRMVLAGGLAAIKATLSMAGVECGPPRLPLKLVTQKQYATLLHDLERLNYFKEIASGVSVGI